MDAALFHQGTLSLTFRDTHSEHADAYLAEAARWVWRRRKPRSRWRIQEDLLPQHRARYPPVHCPGRAPRRIPTGRISEVLSFSIYSTTILLRFYSSILLSTYYYSTIRIRESPQDANSCKGEKEIKNAKFNSRCTE